MKYKFFVLFFINSLFLFGQSEVTFFKDTTQNLSLATITLQEFSSIKNNVVIEEKSNSNYWFKIPKLVDNNKEYIFYIRGIDVYSSTAYQQGRAFQKLKNQRYITYKINRDFDTYIKIDNFRSAHFPFYLMPEEAFFLREKKVLIYNGFYYGFSFLVILYSLVYFSFFKDTTFLHYALMLTSIGFGIFILDGSHNLFHISKTTTEYIVVINYVALAFFASKFVNSFLFLEGVFPNLKKYTYTVGVSIVIVAIAYIFTNSFFLFKTLNFMVFVLLFVYWFTSLILFNKNIYNKILVIAFAMLLFSSIDSLLFTKFGFYALNTNPLFIKIGGILQITILCFAVISREKILRKEYALMKNDIIEYSMLNTTANTNDYNLIDELSFREKEIFDLIVTGDSNKIIAYKLNISVNTVKFHIKNIYDKLNITSRKEAVSFDKS